MGRSAGWSSSRWQRVMSVRRPLQAMLSRPSTQRARVRATVFGLDVHSEIALSFLEGSTAKPTGRTLEISCVATDARSSTGRESAELVCDERQPTAALIFRIEAHPEAGYLISGPELRRASASQPTDGVLRCAPGVAPMTVAAAADRPGPALRRAAPGAGGLSRQRRRLDGAGGRLPRPLGRRQDLAGAGALPAGRELPGRRRARAGARADELLAHPGHAGRRRRSRARRSGSSEADELYAGGDRRATNAREQLVRMAGAAEPAPLAALFFLDRRSGWPSAPALRARHRRPAAARRDLQLRARHSRSACAACSMCARSPHACGWSGSRPARRRTPRELGAAVEQRLSSPDVTRWLAGVFDPRGRADSSRLAGALAPARRRRSSTTDRCESHTAGRRSSARQPLCLLDGFLDNASELSAALEAPGRLIARGAARRRLAALGAGAAAPPARRLRAARLGSRARRGAARSRPAGCALDVPARRRRRAVLRQRDSPPAGAAAPAPRARPGRASPTG